jgi:Rrf2 family iron-sulfur cluster assembly transcriptional regulator
MVITRCGFVYFSWKLDLYQKGRASLVVVCFNIGSQKKVIMMKIACPQARSATLAMVALASRQGKEGCVRLEDLATLQQQSLSYLEQMFKRLKTAKLVESKRGPNGGYRTKDIKTVTVAAIVSAITGDEVDPDPIWSELSGRVRNDLSKVTLFDLTR